MSCDDAARQTAQQLARMTFVARGSVDALGLCRYPRCDERLNHDGECPRGHRQTGPMVQAEQTFLGRSVLDRERWGPLVEDAWAVPLPLDEGDLIRLYRRLDDEGGILDFIEQEESEQLHLSDWINEAERSLQGLRVFVGDVDRAYYTDGAAYALEDAFSTLERSPHFGGWHSIGGNPQMVRDKIREWQEAQDRRAMGQNDCPECGGELLQDGPDSYTCEACGGDVSEGEDGGLEALTVTNWVRGAEGAIEEMESFFAVLEEISQNEGKEVERWQLEKAISRLEQSPYFGNWPTVIGMKESLLDEVEFTKEDAFLEDLRNDWVVSSLASTGRERLISPVVLAPPDTEVERVLWQRQVREKLQPSATDLGATADEARTRGHTAFAFRLYQQSVRYGLDEGDDNAVALGLFNMAEMILQYEPPRHVPYSRPAAYLCLQKAVEFAEAAEAPLLTAECYRALAKLAAEQAGWSDTLRDFGRALDIFVERDQSDLVLATQRDLAEAAYQVALRLGGQRDIEESACLFPDTACHYAQFVEKRATRRTWPAVKDYPCWAKQYRQAFGEQVSQLPSDWQEEDFPGFFDKD